MVVRLDVRRLHKVDAARIDDDQLGAFAQSLFHARAEHGVRIGRVGADDQHHVGLVDALEVLRAGSFAERLLQAIAGRGVADAGARIDVVVVEGGANQLLHGVDFLVCCARRSDAADRRPAVLRLRLLEPLGGVVDRFVPRDALPRVGDLLADYRCRDAILVRRIAERETALDARVTLVGATILVGHHAHDFFAPHLGLERAADAAIGAGRDDRVLGLAHIDHGLLDQGRCRTSLHAGAARHAFGRQERFVHAGRDVRGKAATVDRQRERALNFFAGAYAARADDALRRFELEIGVGRIFRLELVVLLPSALLANTWFSPSYP